MSTGKRIRKPPSSDGNTFLMSVSIELLARLRNGNIREAFDIFAVHRRIKKNRNKWKRHRCRIIFRKRDLVMFRRAEDVLEDLERCGNNANRHRSMCVSLDREEDEFYV